MIQINKLSKVFHSGGQVFDIFSDLNIHVQNGECIAIVWPSGSGKTTILNMISGIYRDDIEGEILVDGKNILQLSSDQMTLFRGKNISYIFQNFQLLENLTVAENIDFIIELNRLQRNFSTDEILEIVGLSHKKHVYAFHLSGGEKQRVAIGRAFVGKTKILLADEPTGALDEENKKKILDLMMDLHKKTKNTILMITHDPEVAQRADRSYTVSGKKLVAVS